MSVKVRKSVVEIERDELDHLRITARRWNWLLGFWARTTGDDPVRVIANIDSALDLGHSPADAAEFAAACRREPFRARRQGSKPPPFDPRA